MSLHQAEEVVLRLMQPDFIQKLKEENKSSKEKKHFTVKSIDEGDVLDIAVHLSDDPHTEDNQVTFEWIKKFPDGEQPEKSKLVQGAFEKLDESCSIQIALLIDEDNKIKAYTRKPASKDLPKETTVLLHPSKDLLYSRSKGILESGLLERRKVAIVGLGSGGSHVAIELAKAGVGRFVLVDYDRVELHNVVRHSCGVSDLGRLKTKAIRDKILDKNPFAEVELHNCDINDPETGLEILDGCDLIIAATDNSESRKTINMISMDLKIVTLYGKCAERANAGEVVVVRPEQGSPCFVCVCGTQNHNEEISSFRQARERAPNYVSNSDIEANIQVGLSSDIIPISNMIVKIALVELCKGQDSALATLEEDFKHPYYVWANRCEAKYLEYQEGALDEWEKCSVLRWYAEKDFVKCKDCELQDAESKSS